jgi:energy-converting hydrogenase B subunit D
MSALIAALFTLVAVGAVCVVFTEQPARQAVTLSTFGLLMSLLFMVVAAPDVALSQIGVGTAIVPLMVLLAIRATSHGSARGRKGGAGGKTGDAGTDR